jgi:hypothetical protein
MAGECSRLGAHGVVGVLLTVGEFAAGGLEFHAIGTAVRVPGARPLGTASGPDRTGPRAGPGPPGRMSIIQRECSRGAA